MDDDVKDIGPNFWQVNDWTIDEWSEECGCCGLMILADGEGSSSSQPYRYNTRSEVFDKAVAAARAHDLTLFGEVQ